MKLSVRIPRIFSLQNAIILDANDANFQLVQTTSNDCLKTGLFRQTCSLLVTFTPKPKGNLTGTVTVNDLAGKQIVHLSGTGN